MNKDLITYIENEIFPLYERNDVAHRIWHIYEVIERSLKLASNYDVNMDMVYTIASFHDIGCYLGREKHEEYSANIMAQDKFINEYFTKEQIEIMKEAIIDHRGSLEYVPRSIYGKIISTADRFVSIEGILKSTHSFTLEFMSDLSWEEQIKRSYEYIENKYGKKGYAKIWVPSDEYNNFINTLPFYLENKEEFENKLKEVDKSLKKEYFHK